MVSSTTSRPIPRIPLLARVDFGLLFTLVLCVFALWPLLYRPGLPNGNDVLYHVYRAAEMDRAWSHGLLMPRWAEAFYTGYGSPLFHYYASLSYYVSSLLMRLLGLTALDSMRALIVLCTFMSGAGTYLFVRPRSGVVGGVIAALCYVYSPYMLFTEPYSRGAYPELVALSLFPLVMWCFDRLIVRGRRRDVVLAAVSLTALILTHNLMGLVMTVLLLSWLLWVLLTHALAQGRAGIRPHMLALGTAGLGIGLAAYFWIPVILDSGAVRLDNLTAVAQLYYANFFIPLRELLTFSPRFDAGAINGLQHQFNLGVPQWLLAVIGLVSISLLWLNQKKYSPQATSSEITQEFSLGTSSLSTQYSALSTVFFALAGGACLFLILPAAEAVWGVIFPLAALQFPWRFLGPVAFCLAVMAGKNGVWIARLPARVGGAVTVTFITAIVAFAMPLLYITEWDHPTIDTSVAAYQEAEVRGLQRATTFSNEYLPRAVEVEPDATDSLLADYADGYPVDHLNPATLPAGVTARLIENAPEHSTWQVASDAPFIMEVLIFDWVGWTAEIDGQQVPITPSDPHGLITFPVPAGDHTVHVYLASTPARDLGIVVTFLSFAGILAVASWVDKKHSLQITRRQIPPEFPLSTQHSALSTSFAIAFVLTFLLVIVYMREGVGWVSSPPGEALLAQYQTDHHLGDSIRLLGYDLNGNSLSPGEAVELSVYWYTAAPIPYGYASFVHISMGGPPLAQADKQNPAGRPTKEWTSEGYIRDDYTIDLPDTMPPGEYQVYIGLYTCDTLPAGECGNGDRLIVSDEAGNPVGDAVPLQTITVR